MEKDYLWDKTGADAEIERLENALQAFRYKETAPPVLPAKVLPFKKDERRKVFPFAFAAAACLAFVTVGLGIWLQISNDQIKLKNNTAKTITNQSRTEFLRESRVAEPNDLSVKKSDFLMVKKVKNSKQSSKRKIVLLLKNVQNTVPQKETKIQKNKALKPEIRLTKEEQYAYNQLRLALSITSSKLKLVKDKVEGIEEKPVVRKQGR